MNDQEEEKLPEFKFQKRYDISCFNLWRLIKNNLAIFLLLPALIGGCYQIWQLTNIQLSFMRFFSVSQALADGLMVILGFFFLTISIIYTGLLTYVLPTIKPKNSIKIKVIKIFFISIIIYILVKLNLNDSANLTKPTEIVIFMLLKLTLLIVSIYLVYSIGHIFYLYRKGKDELYNEYLIEKFDLYKKKFELLGVALLSIIIYIFGSSAYDLLLSFNDYSNINNFSLIEQRTKSNSMVEINPKVVFYNKDYLFINLKYTKSCTCDFHKQCDKQNIYQNYQWIEDKFIVLDGKELFEVYK